MKITVDEIGADGTRTRASYDYSPNDLTNTDVMDIERVCDCSFDEYQRLAQAGSMLALTAQVWMARRQSQPNVRFAEVKFALDSVEIDLDDEEAAQTLASIAPEKRDAFLESLPDDQRERLDVDAPPTQAPPGNG